MMHNGDRRQQIIHMSRRTGDKVRRWIKKNLRWLVIAVVLAILALNSYYQIEPDEVGIVTRFGKFVRTAEPGPHLKMPLAEEVSRVPIQRQLKQEFGFRTKEADVQTEYEKPAQAEDEAVMLTGDLNVAHVEWIIQYKIQDPYLYLFKVRDVTSTLRDMSETTMRQVVGDHSVTEVLTIGREEIQMEAKEELQRLCDRYETGIEVLQLVLQDVNPPESVRPSFNEVNQAIQERERAINQAWAKYNQVIPEARGKASQAIRSAEGYATERVNHAEGDVARFNALQREYAKAPTVTRTRLYLETVKRALPRASRRVLIDSSLDSLLPLLSLDSAAPPRPTGPPPAAGSVPKGGGQ
jgi:modulator of FtsH protease HflK